jgi:hypothetical protein
MKDRRLRPAPAVVLVAALALLLAALAAVALPAAGAADVTFSGPEQLGRPTATSIALNVVPDAAADVYVQYGTSAKSYAKRTATVEGAAGKPLTVAITGLKANTRYYYRVRYRPHGAGAYLARLQHTFMTQRAKGSAFTFELQGDSHPERVGKQFNADMYRQTLGMVAADKPDFFLCMGDDFSVDTLKDVNEQTVTGRYTLQRPYLSILGASAPVFLVNGNHEQASMANLDGTAANVAVWAQNARNSYFPQPAPDGFYTGDTQQVDHIGLLRDYYAWAWGDALFVVIDPYWHSPVAGDNAFGGGSKRSDMWEITLGDAQYAWLQKTLESSKATFKFVFTHHVLGTGRGGVKVADLCEWGGQGKDGTDQFAAKRPTWEKPVQQLMADTHVSIFFQGHDHLFAHEELDGVVYQELPSPADPNYAQDNASSYTGDVLPSSGRVRVTVSAQKVHVEYVRTWLPADATSAHPNGEVAFEYDVLAR